MFVSLFAITYTKLALVAHPSGLTHAHHLPQQQVLLCGNLGHLPALQQPASAPLYSTAQSNSYFELAPCRQNHGSHSPPITGTVAANLFISYCSMLRALSCVSKRSALGIGAPHSCTFQLSCK